MDTLRASGGEEREVLLPTGTLGLEVHRAIWPLDSLCDFAIRRNPRRAFLVVSKVLGRHIPARPSVMRAAMRDLAAALPNLPSPTLVVGLAETAVCLGQGVHGELARRPGWDGLYLHSTRQQVDHPLLCRFDEPHSHASAHLIYRPLDVDLAAFRSLVLVDDEVSTGTTLTNLAAALVGHLPGAERIAVATLTDWSGNTGWLERMPRPATCASLLSGRLTWTPDPDTTPPRETGFDRAAPALGHLPNHSNTGRLGIRAHEPVHLPQLDLSPGTKLRVVGTGEFTHPPFLLAEQLEQAGHDVMVQATSRSPTLPGGAIRHSLSFADNYATAVPNFLYNADPADGRLSLICHETPAGSVDRVLLDALRARSVHFEGTAACAP